MFVMSRNLPPHTLAVRVKTPTKTPLHNNGKVTIMSNHRPTLNETALQIVKKTINEENTAIPDGAEHRMVPSASQELVEIALHVALAT